MQPITVAIADENVERRARFERSLQGNQGVRVLTNTTTNEGGATGERRLSSRANMTAIEDVTARTRRLSPRILLVNLKQCTEADGALLESLRRECPDTLVVLLAEESDQQEEQIMQALAKGARGYLGFEADPMLVSKAAQVIDRGEAWVPRKMLGKIMDQMLNWCHGCLLEPAIES